MQESLRYQGDRFRVVHVVPDPDSGLPSRDVIRHPGAVVILPLIDSETLCLIRNKRLSVSAELIELPAGTRNLNEPPETTAVRELEEETGWCTRSLESLGVLLMSPGILDERMHVYVARDLEAAQQKLEPDEQITTLPVSIQTAFQWVEDGTIVDAKTVAALLLFRLKTAEGRASLS